MKSEPENEKQSLIRDPGSPTVVCKIISHTGSNKWVTSGIFIPTKFFHKTNIVLTTLRSTLSQQLFLKHIYIL